MCIYIRMELNQPTGETKAIQTNESLKKNVLSAKTKFQIVGQNWTKEGQEKMAQLANFQYIANIA